MRSMKELIRLKFEHQLSNRAIAKSCGISHTVVNHYVLRCRELGLSWPLPDNLDDETLETMLFGNPAALKMGSDGMPPMEYLYNELSRKGVTLALLWHEYKQANPEGYEYSWFCEQYRAWRKTLEVTLRQKHRAGERLFVDWAGQTMPIVDSHTGVITQAEIFIASLGASSYTYAEARASQDLFNWIEVHVNLFGFLGGVPEILVPDNLKVGVTSPCRYEPAVNPTYHDLAVHYGVAVIPARPNHPKDKAKVESAVGFAERFILAALRNRTFFSLTELNQAIREKLTELNQKKFQKLDASRQELFERLDKPALKPLPAERYEYARFKKARVNIDYHIEVDRHYYSVPYQLVKKEVDVRLTVNTLEVLVKGKRVAAHRVSRQKGGFTTLTEHMPERHKKYLEWTPSRIMRWAGETGPNTRRLITAILNSKMHPQQGYRSSLGIMRLAKAYTPQRLEAASSRALAIQAFSYKSVLSILKHGLDQQPLLLPSIPMDRPARMHENIRGNPYYQTNPDSKEEQTHVE